MVRWTVIGSAVLASALLTSLATDPAVAAEPVVEFLIGNRTAAEGGTWTVDESPLNRPFGIDFDAEANMLLVELEGGRVFRRSRTGGLTHLSGDGSRGYSGDGGVAGSATFNGMHNCAVTPAGDLYISDSWNHCVRHINLKTGLISTVAGTGQAGFSGDGGPATEATFDYLMCVALNHDNSVLHITDLGNRRIRALDLKTGLVTTVAGNGQKGTPADGQPAIESPLIDPRAAAADSEGNIYVLERGGHALRVVQNDGRIRTIAGTGQKGFADGPALTASLNSPKHLCLDEQGTVYIADDENAAIRMYLPGKQSLTTLLGRGHGDPTLHLVHPHGVCWHDGWLYVVDSGNHRVLRMKHPDSPGSPD